MFKAKTEIIERLAGKYPKRIEELEKIFDGKTNIYIDFANVRPWSNKLGWHVDPKRLKQFLDSFDNIGKVNFYYGTLEKDRVSEQFAKEIRGYKYELVTKPVKIMSLSIDVSSIPSDSPDIIKNFVRGPLLKKFKVETIEYLNNELLELNKQGIKYIEDMKCNFDVEIGRDMLIDYERNSVETFVLWSGDSDFADPVAQLLKDKKKVILFATARRVAKELNGLQKDGLVIFDIQKIRDFVCWKKELKN
ncbi:MAG: NYN domain-containing protein [Patescibacteria group bacterium]